MDEFKLWTELGIGGALAGVLFFFYRKDVKQFTELWQAQATLNFQQTQAMMALIERTSITISQNTEVVKSLHRRMDRLDILRLFPDDQRAEGAQGSST